MAEEHDDKLKREFGISRRDLIRRGAVVGGALLWVAPTIQTIAAPAFANPINPGGNKSLHYCCACFSPGPGGATCEKDHPSQASCISFCGGQSNVKTYTYGVHHCTCDASDNCQCA